MNFYKYQNKLMSVCENMSFKCAECYQSFLTQSDLQCHMYDRHQQKHATTEVKDVKQEEMTGGDEVNVGGGADKAGEKGIEKPIKKESLQDEVNVKTEHLEKDDGDERQVNNDCGTNVENSGEDDNEDEDEDEELIDVGVNNRVDEKPRADDADAH